MGDLSGIKIEGGAKLRSTLRKAGLNMKDLTAVNRAAANVVLPAAKSMAPVGDPKNGHIKTTVRIGATQRAGVVRAGNKTRPYGGVIHWGWPARNIKAQPWIAEAAKSTEGKWLDLYWERLNKTIDSVKGD